MKAFDVYHEITRDFMIMFDEIFETNTRLQNIAMPMRCHVTTITFVAKLSESTCIRPETLESLHAMEGIDTFFTTIGPCAFSKACVEFHSALLPSVRTKLFNKGALQITGCKSHLEAMHTISEICRVLSTFYGHPIEAVSMDIALINLNVTLDKGICLTKCALAMRQKGIIAEQPERPPSCILRFPGETKTTTMIVYKPGKFVICGAPKPRDVSRSYRIVMQTLDEMCDVLEKKNIDALRRGRGHYTWSQLVQCGMPGSMHTHNPTSLTSKVPTCLYCSHFGNCFRRHRT